MTSVDCRCGGRLTATVESLEAKATAVRYHQTTEMHRLWVMSGRPDVFHPGSIRHPLSLPEPPQEAVYEGRLSTPEPEMPTPTSEREMSVHGPTYPPFPQGYYYEGLFVDEERTIEERVEIR